MGRSWPASALALVRARNLVMTAAGVLIGGVLAQGSFALPPQLLWAALSAVLIAAAGNVANDVADREADRINRPDRPLVGGGLTVGAALLIGGMAGGLGLVIAWMLGRDAFVMSFVVLSVMLSYSPLIKQHGLIGNIVIALFGGLPMIYGALVMGWWRAGLVAAVLAAVLHFAREVVKDLEDVAGDEAQGRRTVPIAQGRDAAFVLAAAALIAFVPASLAPWFAGWYGPRYGAVVLVLDLGILVLIARLLGRQLPGARAALKGAMLAGIAALLWDRL